MIKKIAILLFAFNYLLSVTGLALNKHYCEGELSCVSLLIPDDCCECPDGEDASCCADAGVFLKASDDSHLSASSSFDFVFYAETADWLNFSFQPGYCSSISEESYYFFTDIPPPDRVIVFCTLLI